MTSPRAVAMLGLLVWLLAGLQFVQVFFYLHGQPPWVSALTLLGSVGLGACWSAWRRTGRRWLLLVLCLAAFASTGVEGGGSGVLTMLVGVALATYGWGWVGGLLVVGVLTLVGEAFVLLTGHGHGLAATVVESVASVVILSLGVLVGQLLRELDRERRRNAALLDEVRRAAVVEQELMLADERARSARELHDGLGHQLTLVVLSLEYAERMRDRDPGRAFDEVAQARETASAALAHMRRWVRALNPPREPAVSGNAAFEAIAQSFRGTGLDVRVTHTGAERELDRDASLFALRMVQEGLTNVLRHSSADVVRLHLDWMGDHLRLALADNGAQGADLAPGFGLRSLAERAEALGGTFTARSTGDGVELLATVPVREAS